MAHDPISAHWRPDSFARRWDALARRRREYLTELYESGRWRRYYSEEAFQAQMSAAVQEVEGWRTMVKPTDAEMAAPLELDDKRPRPRAA